MLPIGLAGSVDIYFTQGAWAFTNIGVVETRNFEELTQVLLKPRPTIVVSPGDRFILVTQNAPTSTHPITAVLYEAA